MTVIMLTMRCLFSGILFLGLATGLPVMAQQAASNESSNLAPATGYRPGSLLKYVPIYLHYVDGRWSASLTGDLKDPATELVEVRLADGSAQVKTKQLSGPKRPCLTKMKDRGEFGYLDCNSAFYSANKGSAVAGTLIRGVLSLGILTATDAASGSTAYTVSFDPLALNDAISESGAVDLAKESLPLLEYRALFARANSTQQLRTFIATFEGAFDPESLVAKAKERLPIAAQQEEASRRHEAEEAARQAEVQRQKEIRRLSEQDALAAYRGNLRPGDRVAAKWRDGRNLLFGMVIEMKPPLAYVQWENATPNMQWVRLEALLPPR